MEEKEVEIVKGVSLKDIEKYINYLILKKETERLNLQALLKKLEDIEKAKIYAEKFKVLVLKDISISFEEAKKLLENNLEDMVKLLEAKGYIEEKRDEGDALRRLLLDL